MPGLIKTEHSCKNTKKAVEDLGYNISRGTIGNICHKRGVQRSAANAGEIKLAF